MPRARANPATTRQPNRSDLTRPAPVTTVPDQPYGQAAEQAQAQRSIPMGPSPVATPAPGAGAPAGPPDVNGMMAALQAHAAAGGGPHPQGLLRPTERPNEPVTHGIAAGPGAGPEALTGVGAAARNGAVDQATLGNLLSSLTSTPGTTSAVVDLAQRLSAGAA